MKHPFILLAFFCVFSFYPINSQYGITEKQVDSLENILERHITREIRNKLYNNLWQATIDNDIKRAQNYAEKIIENGKEMKNDTIIAQGFNRLGIVYSYLNEYTNSIANYKKSLSISQNWEDKTMAGHALINIAFDFGEQDKIDSCFIYKDKALKSFQHENDSLNIATVYRFLSDVYAKQGYYKLSLQSAIISSNILEKYDEDGVDLHISYLDIARSYEELKDSLNAELFLKKSNVFFKNNKRARWESSAKLRLAKLYINNVEKRQEAIRLFEEGIQISEELNFTLNVQLGTFNYAILIRKMGDLKKSEQMLEKSLMIAREKNLKNGVASCLLELGHIYMNRLQYDKATNFILEGLQISKNGNLLEQQSKAYSQLSRINEIKHLETEALGFYKKFKEINDSIFNTAKSNQIQELKTIYETEKKETALALQEEEIKTLNEKSRADKLKKGLYAGGMTSALALSGLLIFGFRQRTKKNKLAREKQEAIYIQEIAHKKKELASQTLHLVQKNTFIQELMDNLESIKNSPEKFKVEFRRIIMLLKKENASDKDWEVFKTYFADVHNDFDQKLKTLNANISEKEIRLASFLRMKLSTKEIAVTINVLPESILTSKYRLKKKLGLAKEVDLIDFLNTL